MVYFEIELESSIKAVVAQSEGLGLADGGSQVQVLSGRSMENGVVAVRMLRCP